MVHRIVQFGLASLLTTTLAAGAAWAQDEPAGGEEPAAGEEPAGDGTTTPAGDEAGGGGEMAAEAPKPLHFGVAGVVVIPLSPEGYTDTAGIGIGALGGATYALSPKLALAGHVGFIYHLPKNDFTQIHIPILAGIRFMVIPKLALGADTGLNIIHVSFDIAGTSDSDTNTRIPLALHAAYAITPQLVAGGGLWIPNLLLTEEGEDTALGLALYVGYMF